MDDFGAGYAGLNLLAAVAPDLLKLDMELVRGIDTDSSPSDHRVRRLRHGSRARNPVVAEGVETEAEARTLRAMGISLMQGHLFARPEVQSLPSVVLTWPASVAVA